MTVTGPGDSELPRTPDEMNEFMDGLTFTDMPVEAPPRMGQEPAMVLRSLRLPPELDRRAQDAATASGLPVTTLMRRWIEEGLTREEGAGPTDPVTELGRILADANRIYPKIAGGRNAA